VHAASTEPSSNEAARALAAAAACAEESLEVENNYGELTLEQVDAFVLSLKYVAEEGSTFEDDIDELADSGLRVFPALGGTPSYLQMIMFFNDIASAMTHTAQHRAFRINKLKVTQFYLESGHKLDAFADSGESILDSHMSCQPPAPTSFFSLFSRERKVLFCG